MEHLAKFFKGIYMEKLFYPTLCVIIMSICGAYVYKSTFETTAMEKNITSAIDKGIDPIAVRCAYAQKDDNICVAYALTHGETPPAPLAMKKK